MKSCPACHRMMPAGATVCPHADCGAPVTTSADLARHKRPPQPGAARLTTADLAPGHIARRGPLRLASLRRNRALIAGGFFALFLLAGALVWLMSQRGRQDAVVATPRVKPQSHAPAADAKRAPRPAAATTGIPAKATTDRPSQSEATAILTEPPTAPSETEAIAQSSEARDVSPQPVGIATTSAEDKLEGDRRKQTSVEAPPAAAAKTGESASKPVTALPAATPYALRTLSDRREIVLANGGTVESEAAVEAGLAWLARHQAADGHWGPDCLGSSDNARCERQHPCDAAGRDYPAAQTGLALLALQAGGHYWFNNHKYSQHVDRGQRWLAAQQRLDGALAEPTGDQEPDPPDAYVADSQCWMYEHAIATFALADACAAAEAEGQKPDAQILGAAVLAVRFIEQQQHQDGGWRYTTDPDEPSDASVSEWPMLALCSAVNAHINVNPQTLSALVDFFKGCLDPDRGTTGYQEQGVASLGLTAVGMLVDEFVSHQTNSPLIVSAAPLLAEHARERWGNGEALPQLGAFVVGNDAYYDWYNGTLAMFHAGGEPWQRWNSAVRDQLIAMQIRDGDCHRGSWLPESQIALQGGRIYTTALAVLTLEVYYRYSREASRSR